MNQTPLFNDTTTTPAIARLRGVVVRPLAGVGDVFGLATHERRSRTT